MMQLQRLVELLFPNLQGSNLLLTAQNQLLVPIEQLQKVQEPSSDHEVRFTSRLIETQLLIEQIQAKELQSSSKPVQHGQQQVLESYQFHQHSEAFREWVMPFDQNSVPFNEFQGQMLQFQRQMADERCESWPGVLMDFYDYG
ncbi:OLC1v1018910C1 [Oldenlandia corymbosa var. corymbosa]|uniref:OLC1v1018910C1 n=1 Tax=Oldenlandia corymbosa var. corymbosa TaxID=529605 RepID=A0AAV1ECT2_OLDCO|nr:OLC1v1018910C1 [Oldenlandia corymbosa var. corymbosa]